MEIQLIAVPFDSGQRSFRMGRGPQHLLDNGIADALAADGHGVSITVLDSRGNEIESAFHIARQMSIVTQDAVARGALPIVLAGNCISSLGAFAGLGSNAALVWLDAHADLNTPETSPSGFLDGMALTVITGRSYLNESATVPGFVPLTDERLIMMGVRSVDAGEEALFAGVKRARNAAELSRQLDALDTKQVYLHVDLDVLDASVARANHFAEPDGLSKEEVLDVIATVRSSAKLRGAALTAYDPEADERALPIAKEIIRALAS